MDNYLNIKPDVNLNSLTDFQTDNISKLNNIPKKNLTEQQKKEFEKASRGFESIFVNMMFKQMKQSMLDKENNEEGDMTFGDNVLGEYTDLLVADQISKTGKGIGLAEKIYEHLTGGDPLKPAITITPEKAVTPPLIIPEPPKPPIAPQPLKTEPKTVGVNGNFIERVSGRMASYDGIIKEASAKFNLPENLLKAVITAESAGKPNAVSSAGAKGLMQLMDGTAKDLGVKNSLDPKENIFGGARYLKMMLDRFNNNLDFALAAYNSGPGAVEKHSGIPPYKETQNYVARVKKYNQIYQQ